MAMNSNNEEQQAPSNNNNEMLIEQQHHDDEEESSSSKGEESSSSEDESSSSSSESEDDDNNEGLSEYELLRKRNIQRNQRRLKQLGLLTYDNKSSLSASASAASSNNDSSNKNNKPRGSRKKQQQRPMIRRSLPRRNAKLRRFVPGAGDYSNDYNSANSMMLGNNNSFHNSNNNIHYDSDESSQPPSPIKIQRILHPQPHQQVGLSQNNNNEGGGGQLVLGTRRIKRGRPKKHEYSYKCNEICVECNGEWILDKGEDRRK